METGREDAGTHLSREEIPGGGAGFVNDEAWMRLALDEARAALAHDEVPIGAVVVRDGAVLGRGRNRCRELRDPTAHAEFEALRAAFALTGDMRLPGATVYTTVEPCFMCAGALSHARVARVVWAVRDPKFGGAASLGTVLTDARLNHRATVCEGVLADEARALLQGFFRAKRAEAKRADPQRADWKQAEWKQAEARRADDEDQRDLEGPRE
ncbi:MAG: tRNA adenosine(34) deaminase TadA [Planctomycetota bacterium]